MLGGVRAETYERDARMPDVKLLDSKLLKPTTHRGLALGALFLPVVKNGDHYLAGRVNNSPVLVVLDGEKPFEFSDTEQWSRAPGLMIQNFSFVVDPASAELVRDGPTIGSLVVGEHGIVVMARSPSGTHGVYLGDRKESTRDQETDVGFKRWQITASPSHREVTLFSSGS